MKYLVWIATLVLLAGLAVAQEKGAPPGPPPGQPGGPTRIQPGGGPRSGPGGPGQPGPGPVGPGQFGPGLIGIGIVPPTRGGALGLHPALMKLPEAKQNQLRKLHEDALKSVESLIGDVRTRRQAMTESLRKYPLDKADVLKQQEALNKLQDQLFMVHYNTLAESQKIVDKDTWDTLMKGMPLGHGGPGPGGPRPDGPMPPGAKPGQGPGAPGPRSPAK